MTGRDSIDLYRMERVLDTNGKWYIPEALGNDSWRIDEMPRALVKLPGMKQFSERDLADVAAGVVPKLPKGTELEFINRRIIVSCGPFPGVEGDWLHASISTPSRMPTYEDLVMLHRAFWGTEGWSYQVFAPTSDHVNLSQYVLHLWGRPDGSALLPNFGAFGTI